MDPLELNITPKRIRKSNSFHSGDTHTIKIYTNEDRIGNINPLWDRKPMVRMEISPTAASSSADTGNVFISADKTPSSPIMYVFICRGKKWCIAFAKKHYIECINVSLCVLLHVFVMIIFEIYFYFNYVVVIEKAAFIQKINEYFEHAEKYKYNTFISLDTVSYNRWLNVLYAEYMASRNAQAKLLYELLQKACEMGSAFGVVLLVIGGFALYNRDRIRWKTILAENIGMLALLGFFEYLFFTRIIMNYNPISDAELEYLVAKKTYDIFAKNGTMHYL